MQIELEISLPEDFSEEQVKEAVALYRANWDSNSEETVEQAFNRSVTQSLKDTFRECIIQKESNELRLSIVNKFND